MQCSQVAGAMGRRRSRRRDDDKDDDNMSSTFLFTELATGWHVLKVEGYSKISDLGFGRRLKSCPFVVGGHTWCITYFPDGLTEDTADWISFALRLEGRAAGNRRGDIVVRTTFSLHDVGGGLEPSHSVSCGLWTFSTVGQSWGHERFMERKEFESSHVKDDEFYIRCDVTVLSSSAAPPTQPDLRRQLGDLLASGDGADVTLEVGGESFRAHKNVLAARSPVFKAEFFGGGPYYKETAAAHVSIHGVEPSVFRALLHFIYTDLLPDDIDESDWTAMAQHLLVAADRYGVERLKSICQFVLSTFLDKRAVVTTLVIAEQHGCHKLKEACFNFLKASDNYKKLMVGEGLEYLTSTCPSLLQELHVDEQHDC